MRLVADKADIYKITSVTTLETNNLLILRDSVLRDCVYSLRDCGIDDSFEIAKIYEVAICIYQPPCH